MELGSIGKAKTILKFIEFGYDVFIEFEGKSPFDLIIHKEGKIKRVEVKTTKTRTKYNNGWEFQIKKVRPNKNKNKIYNFDKNQCDILSLYIQPLDRIFLIESKYVETKTVLVIKDKLLGSVAEWLIASDLKSDKP